MPEYHVTAYALGRVQGFFVTADNERQAEERAKEKIRLRFDIKEKVNS